MIQKETSLKTIRTYKDDIAQAMKNKKESLVSITAAENKRRILNGKLGPYDSASKRKYLKKTSVVILSAALFVLGAGSILYFYGKSSTEVIIEPKPKIPSIIFSEKNEEFEITNLSRRQILNELTAIKNNTRLSTGEMKNVLITETFVDSDGTEKARPASARDFLSAIDAKTAASFMRSLEPVFMLGIYTQDNNQPFLILKTSFYENAFAGMLEWEKNIKDDLAPLFGSADFGAISNENSGTSTLPVAAPAFSDFVIKNKDARILKNSAGEIVLMYSFIDKNTIVITTNESAFREILTRMASPRVLR